MATNNPKFGQTDAQMAKIFGLSASEFQKAKKQIIAEMTKPKPKLNKSEQDFIAGQKVKAKITKKTGKYPNTAR